MLDLDPLEARANAATEGPWWNDSHEIYAGPASDTRNSTWIGETCRVNDPAGSEADATFVARARTDVPAMAAEIRRLRAELATARDVLSAGVPIAEAAQEASVVLAAVLALLPADPAEDINASWIPPRHIRAALNPAAPAAGSAG